MSSNNKSGNTKLQSMTPNITNLLDRTFYARTHEKHPIGDTNNFKLIYIF